MSARVDIACDIGSSIIRLAGEVKGKMRALGWPPPPPAGTAGNPAAN